MNSRAAAIVRMGKIPTATDAGLDAKFKNMIARRNHLKQVIAEAEAELGDKAKGIYGLNQKIEDALVAADITVVTCGDKTVTRCNGTNVTLSREGMQQGLLEYGVPADDVTELVEAATNRKPYTYIQITDTKVLSERAEHGGFEVKSGSVKSKDRKVKAKARAAKAGR